MSTYEEGVARLIERIRPMDGDWSPTPLRDELRDIQKQLLELVERLEEQGVAQFDLEMEHDQEPPPIIDIFGFPINQPNYGASYKATLSNMRELANSAFLASEKLPPSRGRHAIPFAALAMVHLKHWHGKNRPKLSTDGPDVRELSDICTKAGKPRSLESIRNHLSAALKDFDPHFYPPGVYEVLTGRLG